MMATKIEQRNALVHLHNDILEDLKTAFTELSEGRKLNKVLVARFKANTRFFIDSYPVDVDAMECKGCRNIINESVLDSMNICQDCYDKYSHTLE